jgi:transglutaminase-like putative cysteine protease
VRFPAFAEGGAPRAQYLDPDFPEQDGSVALRRSAYDRTWRLARSLRRRARTPYDYVAAVERHLRGPDFEYSERPPASPYGVAPLEGFLFDTKAGYCQHYSGAMALLLRMGGVPARVAAGFSPGGYSSSRKQWVVRDTDAHSWVEVWFDPFGWVVFDPTPADTPARSLVAAATTEAGPGDAAVPATDAAGRDSESGASVSGSGRRTAATTTPAPARPVRPKARGEVLGCPGSWRWPASPDSGPWAS